MSDYSLTACAGNMSTFCSTHNLPVFATRAEAEAEVTVRKARAAFSGSPDPQVEAGRCRRTGHPNRWHIRNIGGTRG